MTTKNPSRKSVSQHTRKHTCQLLSLTIHLNNYYTVRPDGP